MCVKTRATIMLAVLFVVIVQSNAMADTDFLIESIQTTLHIPTDFQAGLIEDDDIIIIEIRDVDNDAIRYTITYGYDESTKDYKDIKDMPKKLRQQLQAFYSDMIQGEEAVIEELFDGVPALMAGGIGADNLHYALVVYYMNGFQMTVYAVKETGFTEYELSNVLYFARDGLISIVNATRFDQESYEK